MFTRVFDALWHRPGHSDFPVDSRNENLPEKCIHQNYASRPGGSRRRLFVARTRARAKRLSVGDREEGDDMGFETRGVPSFGPLMHGNQWLQKWVAAAASLFPACYLQGTVQLCRVPLD